jgi:cytidylate kinase
VREPRAAVGVESLEEIAEPRPGAPAPQPAQDLLRRVEVRARRRLAELLSRGISAHLDDIVIDLKARDARDSGRAAAPLTQAEDALLLDTSDMDIDQAIAAAIALVEARIG